MVETKDELARRSVASPLGRVVHDCPGKPTGLVRRVQLLEVVQEPVLELVVW
jgi:hypothetical protein